MVFRLVGKLPQPAARHEGRPHAGHRDGRSGDARRLGRGRWGTSGRRHGHAGARGDPGGAGLGRTARPRPGGAGGRHRAARRAGHVAAGGPRDGAREGGNRAGDVLVRPRGALQGARAPGLRGPRDARDRAARSGSVVLGRADGVDRIGPGARHRGRRRGRSRDGRVGRRGDGSRDGRVRRRGDGSSHGRVRRRGDGSSRWTRPAEGRREQSWTRPAEGRREQRWTRPAEGRREPRWMPPAAA